LRWHVSLPHLALGACIAIAAWLVFVPVAALLYNAFTEDTGFGPGELSLGNFIEAYSSWHILRFMDLRFQPQYRLGQCAAEICV
jgi:hypothetical protein